MHNRPLIGITAFETRRIDPPHLPIYALNQQYVLAVAAAGGVPLIIPPNLDEASLYALFARLNGLLLSGGGDIDPAHYGEAPHPALGHVSADRDRIELALTRRAIELETPLLAICRGVQVLNVALGGSLIQDIPTQVPDALPHAFDETQFPRAHLAHAVHIESGVQLHQVMGVDRAEANSWHHQSIRQVAPGLQVVARAPDGVIEAVELSGHRFVIGVQWHPESLYDRQPEMKHLFEALVQAANER
ncbi:MAG TPA: gamma-glutamyl-gamma-aminobutyrate hydrolase family protein [Anaerolineae bacterium]|nr:gamma-glutamyl-gamma-aminobutyrate hydrolase family protein [Anaerolineae bacterium]